MRKSRIGKTSFYAIFRQQQGGHLKLDYEERIIRRPGQNTYPKEADDRVIVGFKTRRQRDRYCWLILTSYRLVQEIRASTDGLRSIELRQIATVVWGIPGLRAYYPIILTFTEKLDPAGSSFLDEWVRHLMSDTILDGVEQA